jgi:hypothetical protein
MKGAGLNRHRGYVERALDEASGSASRRNYPLTSQSEQESLMDTDDQGRELIDLELGRAVRLLIEENKAIGRDAIAAALKLKQRDEAGTPLEPVLAQAAHLVELGK